MMFNEEKRQDKRDETCRHYELLMQTQQTAISSTKQLCLTFLHIRLISVIE